jgi:hypothetical protein
MPMLQKNMTIISFIFFRTLVRKGLKLFMHLLLQEHQIKQLLQLVFLKRLLIPQLVLELQL